jgi:subtilase family serine protease
VCPEVAEGYASCELLLNTTGAVVDANGPYGPADIQSAYNLPSSTKGKGQTVALIDAYGYPTAESDLAMYRSTYGLPACTSASGCLKIINQKGGTPNYPPNGNWDAEQAVDMAMVSATCPNCNILLVETKTNSFKNLIAGVKQAVTQGAHIISNSYSGLCSSKNENKCAYKAYTYPGVVVLAAAGDNGYWGTPPQDVVPAGLPSVVAVGGTTLIHATGQRGWSETVWSGSGAGCTAFPKPAWQTDSGCPGRDANDVSAVGNPSTGIVVYINGRQAIYGGTSVGTPLNAGIYALAGNASSLTGAQSLYQNTKHLWDVTSGQDGTCTPAYLCTGEVGYDGPTGNGTPNGIGAF